MAKKLFAVAVAAVQVRSGLLTRNVIVVSYYTEAHSKEEAEGIIVRKFRQDFRTGEWANVMASAVEIPVEVMKNFVQSVELEDS